jgi:antitoxin PrlF
MSSVDVVTVSSRGQVSIPADIRSELDIQEGEKLLVVSKGDNILMKKVDASVIDQSFREILAPMWDAASDADVDEDDVTEIIHDHRSEDRE